MKRVSLLIVSLLLLSVIIAAPTTVLMENESYITGQKIFEDDVILILRTETGPLQISKKNISRILTDGEKIPEDKANNKKKANWKLIGGVGVPYGVIGAGVGYMFLDNTEVFLATNVVNHVQRFNMNGDTIVGGRHDDDAKNLLSYSIGVKYYYEDKNIVNIVGLGGYLGFCYSKIKHTTNFVTFSPFLSTPESYESDVVVVALGYQGTLGLTLWDVQVGYSSCSNGNIRGALGFTNGLTAAVGLGMLF